MQRVDGSNACQHQHHQSIYTHSWYSIKYQNAVKVTVRLKQNSLQANLAVLFPIWPFEISHKLRRVRTCLRVIPGILFLVDVVFLKPCWSIFHVSKSYAAPGYVLVCHAVDTAVYRVTTTTPGCYIFANSIFSRNGDPALSKEHVCLMTDISRRHLSNNITFGGTSAVVSEKSSLKLSSAGVLYCTPRENEGNCYSYRYSYITGSAPSWNSFLIRRKTYLADFPRCRRYLIRTKRTCLSEFRRCRRYRYLGHFVIIQQKRVEYVLRMHNIAYRLWFSTHALQSFLAYT